MQATYLKMILKLSNHLDESLVSVILQGRPNAAARLAALPLVASVRTKLSVVYMGAKCSHPGLRSVCEGLESGATAVLSPVIAKLEPHSEYWLNHDPRKVL